MAARRKAKVVHAQIGNPVLVRKTLLETSILSIENLKILKNIRQVKKRKDKLKTELRRQCREMRQLIIEFEGILPPLSEVGIHPQKESEKVVKKVAKKEAVKRKDQEKLMVKTTEQTKNPFEQRDQLDFDIDKLKQKISGL
ncbi:MAG: hypothetical protein CMH62_02990 [Nanoarchaeota archaeon]|nr:hypothetical protein [Nanoarchaeota archaeon]|tara:strand:+ start:1905 stop:2327 length:423 start_codon:yes stop_codon:yes gene_type:complete